MDFIKQKWHYVNNSFRKGTCPKELAIVITLSFLTASFPIFGLSTIIITAISLKYNLNLPLFIVISYSLEPIRILLFIPFNTLGAHIFNSQEPELSIQAIQSIFSSGFEGTFIFFRNQLVNTLVGWMVITVPFSVLFYYLLIEIFNFSLSNIKECSK